jgi:signal transduction histidine kinase
VYAEAEADVINVFVRDRGAGFDPDRVAKRKHGLAESIRGRMARAGGTAEVTSTPGEGTEVELRLRRKA